MGILDSISGSFGNQGAAGNILGGLGTAALIYGLYNQNKQAQDTQNYSQNFNTAQLAENRRQFDITSGQRDEGLAQSAEAAALQAKTAEAQIAAQVQAAHSRAISGAYDSLIKAVESGRGGEAAILSNIIDKVQRAYARS